MNFVQKLLKSCVFFIGISPIMAEFVGIPRAEFEPHYRAQRGQMWCWASCAEMVLSYQGVKLPQEAIVQRIKGYQVDAAGSPVEMINSTNGLFKDEADRIVVVSGQFVQGAPLPTVLYNQLKRKKPVILTYRQSPVFGHAVVITGVDAKITPQGVQILKFHVFDPFCYRQVPTPQGMQFVLDDQLRYREYHPMPSGNEIVIEPGAISGVILVEGVLP